MNGVRLAQLIINPAATSDEDFRELEGQADIYPYFSCLHILNAKIAFIKELESKDKLLTKAAIISPDRVHLKKYLTTDDIFADETLVAEEPEMITVPVPEKKETIKPPDPLPSADSGVEAAPPKIQTPTLPPGKNILDELKENTEAYRQSFQKYLEVLNSNALPPINQDQSDPLADPAQTEEKFRDILESSKKRKTTRKMPKEEQDLLISKFIEAGSENRKPAQSEKNEKTPSEDLSISSTEIHDEMVTETLAGIMINQGKLEKAIDIYHKLIWKFPQKKSYFAAQIEILKEKISKQK